MKPALKLDEQIDLLTKRGLVLDEDLARTVLRDVNYYRFSGYARPFQIAPGRGGNDDFVAGTAFVSVVDLMDFDRKLRAIVFEALQSVETSLRSVFAYSVAVQEGPCRYADPDFYLKPRSNDVMDEIEAQLDRSKEPFIEHYNTEHPKDWPEVWVAVESFSFGLLSTMIQDTRVDKCSKAVADRWSLNSVFFKSLIHHLSYVRNVCAHHSRLWNLAPRISMKDFTTMTHPLRVKLDGSPINSLYRTLVFLDYMVTKIDPGLTIGPQVMALLAQNRYRANGMGFPVAHTLEAL
jgi:abortive infection bacteriophage resistance protein